VPAERLYDAFLDPSLRERWLPDAELRERTATRPTSARFDFGGGPGRVHLTFLAKGPDRSTVALEHRRLPDAAEADRMKTYWRRRVAELKDMLET
jgi:hypothetical protein